MNDEPLPPKITPEEPPVPGSPGAGSVAGMAVVGFLTYAAVGWLSLGFFRAGLGPLVLLLVAAVIMAVKRIGRGFALGVFIGLGVTLLLVGACFAIFAMK
jgi:hypothetical protein